MYSIIGVHDNMGFNMIELDTAETKQKAIDLAQEYRIAFGHAWKITIKQNK